jgi:hypothetical protein
LRRLLVSYFRAASLRCQASSVAGVTGKTSAQRRRGMNRMSAANQVRSAGSYRIWPAFRRSTAFWCRSTSNSAFFSASPRTTRTARLNNQRISRQTILSSTWSASHHRTSIAGERAGQRHDRVSGRHRILRTVGGRPARRRVLASYFCATSLRCQASSVAGVTGKILAHCRRGMNGASAANQARSAGSYWTRPACRRNTAFSCRSTRSSASFARSPRNTSTTSPNNQRSSR